LTIVAAELVLEPSETAPPSDNPFQSPREDGPDLAPRPMTAWRSIVNGASFGFVLGALAGWLFRPELGLPRKQGLWIESLLVLNAVGWHLLPTMFGAVMGWLVWRRAKRRTARSPFSS
jgi:hypothetical protein